ncbi:nucleotide exchange factor GrpE [Candidatus Babeliales bacterium]|nr:nucleotide exchange factor GrpE [Candidatus Babeliales bacterium]
MSISNDHKQSANQEAHSITTESVQMAAEEQPDPLASCQNELVEWKNRCLRATADFENFKKRTEKEKVNWIKMAQGNLIQDLLEVIDDFERALNQTHENGSEQELDAWLRGFKLTSKSLYKFLEKFDVTEITEHEHFNPEFHEAVLHVESPDHISGAIVDVIQKGYMFKDMVLRPAKVSVAK